MLYLDLSFQTCKYSFYMHTFYSSVLGFFSFNIYQELKGTKYISFSFNWLSKCTNVYSDDKKNLSSMIREKYISLAVVQI